MYFASDVWSPLVQYKNLDIFPPVCYHNEKVFCRLQREEEHRMKHCQVFISYKSEDFEQANWLRSMLETNGISCWMAPASIPGGSNYAKEIPQAIENCRVFVLVLTQVCQRSVWVPKELDRALNARKPVMPFVLENCQLNDDFNFYLSNVQQYAAYQNKRAAAEMLLRDIRALLDVKQEPVRPVTPPVSKKKEKKTGKKTLIAALAAIVLLAGAFLGKAQLSLEKPLADPGRLSVADVAVLEEKAEVYLCNYGVDWVTLYREDGGSNDLTAQILATCCTDFSMLEQVFVWTNGERNTLILPFCVSLEKVPYAWLDNVYYEDPLLVDHPALYGFATFPNVELDKKGNVEVSASFDLRISSLYESKDRMMVEISDQFPGELKQGNLEIPKE